MSAYIVGAFDMKTGAFLGADLFSETSPTIGRKWPVVLFTGEGADYEEGIADLRRQFAHPSMAWVGGLLGEGSRADRNRQVLGLPAPPATCIGRDPLLYGSRKCEERRKDNSDLCERHAALLAPHQIIGGVFYVARDPDEEG